MGVSLLLVPTAVLVLALPTWVERQSLARVAAQEAARAVVLADDATLGEGAARAVVARTARNHGLTPGAVAVRIEGGLRRGGVVTAVVSVRVPATTLPGLTGVAPFTVSSRHSERVDRYRSLP